MIIETPEQCQQAWNQIDDHMLNRTLSDDEFDVVMEAIIAYEEKARRNFQKSTPTMPTDALTP